MRFKSINSFIRGIFEKEGTEARIADGFLAKLHNLDLDITGKAKQRRGYRYWEDLTENNSVTSILNLPNVVDKTGFEKKIQTMYYYVDVAGEKHLVVISDKKIYIEIMLAGKRTWVCLNPTGDIDLQETVKHIDIKSYLDILFFNDYQNNVLMYNSRAYSSAGWIIAGNRFVYFAGDKIYFRNYILSISISKSNSCLCCN